mgnify:CR=1 FL=1|jgi:hypothetical protein
MNRTEKLAKWTLEKLLPSGSIVREVKEQSNGEHDFDIVKDDNCIGVIEVTQATNEEAMVSIARKQKQGQIKCNTLRQGWLLMAHNLDPRWVETEGCKHLATLERHGLKEFSHNTKYYSQTEKIAEAARCLNDKGIENGQAYGDAGNISFLISYGEDSEPYIISSESVVQTLLASLEKPDNKAKLSRENHPAHYSRHFFVEINRTTLSGPGFSLIEAELPSNLLDLASRATHVWAATRYDDKIVVWCGNAIEWRKWILVADQ